MEVVVKRFSRGAEWRKWDLHVHVDGTRLSNGYIPPDWDRYCAALEQSDVSVFGITDYFSLDRVFEFRKQYLTRYPETMKVFFPNLELRLNEAVDGGSESVDVHLVFPPDVEEASVHRLLARLETELTDSEGRRIPCAELSTKAQLDQATVSRKSLKAAIDATFGTARPLVDHVMVLVPANNNGIRAASGMQRRAAIADEIDKFAHAILGSPANVEWFLKSDRYEDKTQKSPPKPVFSGSDAHSFDDLDAWLGKSVKSTSHMKNVTWIKADPSYEGLLQTLAEPRERVRIQTGQPDRKQPYHYISKVSFEGSTVFPSEILLNANMCSIIGSRSSGKSALLAHIAHAIDPDYTVEQQVTSGLVLSKAAAGPAAGRTWAEQSELDVRIEWGDPAAKSGKVIYVPQNSLYSISERPQEITAKIKPAAFRASAALAGRHQDATGTVASLNESIRSAVRRWFDGDVKLRELLAQARGFGEREVVEARRDELVGEIARLRSGAASPARAAQYEHVRATLERMRSELESTERDLESLKFFLPRSISGPDRSIAVEFSTKPGLAGLPEQVRAPIEALLEVARLDAESWIGATIAAVGAALVESEHVLSAEIEGIELAHADLISEHIANDELKEVDAEHDANSRSLIAIDRVAAEIVEAKAVMSKIVSDIDAAIASRDSTLGALASTYSEPLQGVEELMFGIEIGLNPDRIAALSEDFNRRDRGSFIDRVGGSLELAKARVEVGAFLSAIANGEQKLRQGRVDWSVAADVLAETEEIRFFAELEGDRIGGFAGSTMTPGKQALFALTLILNESDEPWPLLIDQPEDDLDSRSVFDQILPYLTRSKKRRQIIMVSHNANLVVGADSEQVLVANRHGDDRRNRDSRTFDYMGGSLEHASAPRVSEYILESRGVREHACELLDGGVDAFQKRKEKYHI
jgi:energy-coupling factor transporter ATP-binding protein EcfA2